MIDLIWRSGLRGSEKLVLLALVHLFDPMISIAELALLIGSNEEMTRAAAKMLEARELIIRKDASTYDKDLNTIWQMSIDEIKLLEFVEEKELRDEFEKNWEAKKHDFN